MTDSILVTRSLMPSFEEIKPLWNTGWLTNMGEKHQKLQVALKNILKCRT